mmetsp:Transcript_3430/g.7415  ORF Transcript_3430/g.7415 Transcript_3430/m.7415 type:complete len:332 (+) Transcript_3430:1350-2345(+)
MRDADGFTFVPSPSAVKVLSGRSQVAAVSTRLARCDSTSFATFGGCFRSAPARVVRSWEWCRFFAMHATEGTANGSVPTAQPAHDSGDASDLVPLRGLLLDVDGTLCDTDNLHYEVFRRMLAEHGVFEPDTQNEPISRAFFNQHICGGSNELILKSLFPSWNLEERATFAQAKETRWRELAAGSLSPVRGLEKLMEFADEHKLRRCAVTNAPRPNAETILQQVGALSWLGGSREGLVLGDECKRAKPHPDPYIEGAARLGLHPSECMAAEDSETGLSAAVAASVGMVVGISTSLDAKRLHAAGAQIVVPNWDAPELYRALRARLSITVKEA